ncbi:hypothetical protein [Sphingomonas humi]|uniref:Glycine zipper family protein n=1 Tax=Sphingomonas humi TaxID=335630 RepID=A0ABP7RG52_9SPHN
MRSIAAFLVLSAALACSACSSRPRSFAPQLAAPASDPQAFDAAWMRCRAEVAARTDQRTGRFGSAAAGAAAGTGASLAVGAATAGTYATYGGAAAAVGATIIAAPIALVGGAWGLSKIKKTKKEKAIKAATAQCMTAAGYPVRDWRVLRKREARAIDAAAAQKPHG